METHINTRLLTSVAALLLVAPNVISAQTPTYYHDARSEKTSKLYVLADAEYSAKQMKVEFQNLENVSSAGNVKEVISSLSIASNVAITGLTTFYPALACASSYFPPGWVFNASEVNIGGSLSSVGSTCTKTLSYSTSPSAPPNLLDGSVSYSNFRGLAVIQPLPVALETVTFDPDDPYWYNQEQENHITTNMDAEEYLTASLSGSTATYYLRREADVITEVRYKKTKVTNPIPDDGI